METSTALSRILKEEETKLQKIQTGVFTISEIDCVKSTVLYCNPYKNEYKKYIGKLFTKMLFNHGKKFTPQEAEYAVETFVDQYKYESAETIILFLQKAAKREFGEFYGSWSLATIYHWFADFLQYSIIPLRETEENRNKEPYEHRSKTKTIQQFGKDFIRYQESKTRNINGS